MAMRSARSGDSGAERRSEIGDTARQTGDLTLLVLGKRGLHNVDGGGEHDPDPEAYEQESRCEGPGAGRSLHQGKQQGDPGDCGDKAREYECPLSVFLGEPFGSQRRYEDSASRHVKITPVWMAL